ncbi:MAG: hypothetical protein HZC41_00740 [Chloroflexi bacterium]|nr:hypothetical protein [Chloroflexota bacterium]
MFLAGCVGAKAGEISRIALLAPFEGRYREVGYNALYAAKLAFQEWPETPVELLAVDDGGTVDSAIDRARALAQDPLVKAAVVLGYAATEVETLRACGNLPVVVVGWWGAKPITENVFVLASPRLDDLLTVDSRIEVTEAARLDTPLSGGDVFALAQFARLRPTLAGVTVLSSARLPDAAFAERYQQMGMFVPPPGLLATLTYDVFGWLLAALHSPEPDVMAALSSGTYSGLNGRLRFEQGYWTDAPVYAYEYDAACVQRGGEMCLVLADSQNGVAP